MEYMCDLMDEEEISYDLLIYPIEYSIQRTYMEYHFSFFSEHIIPKEERKESIPGYSFRLLGGAMLLFTVIAIHYILNKNNRIKKNIAKN